MVRFDGLHGHFLTYLALRLQYDILDHSLVALQIEVVHLAQGHAAGSARACSLQMSDTYLVAE